MKVELICWSDAGSTEQDLAWAYSDDSEEEDILIQTVGWVVRETPKFLTVAMDLSDDGQTHTRSRIPIGMIVSRTVLKEIE